MEENFFYFVIYVFSEEHQADDLQWSETLEFCPLDVEVQEVGPLLLFFRISTYLFDSAVDQVFCVPVDCTKVLPRHHLVVLWNASVSLLLIFKELLAEKL